MESIAENFTDKGKTLSPSASVNGAPVEEGSSSRSFELSTADPNQITEDKKLGLELSLSLPNMLLLSGSSPDVKDEQQRLRVAADFVESMIKLVVFEPVDVVAQVLEEMSEKKMDSLKKSAWEMISNPSSISKLSLIQEALERRSDITLEVLLKSHPVQLQILVAMKTGLSELVYYCHVPPSDLAEMYLNLRCRNPKCRMLFSANSCECKLCAQNNGFCRDCICLVCSKFDMAVDTCGWVGCDYCSHCCHADCGLEKGYFRNRDVATADEAEMEFYCVACGHSSEMFGFVKEVFRNCGENWTAEDLSRELKYVTEIFAASNHFRGKRLHEIAIQMLSYLENQTDVQEVEKSNCGLTYCAKVKGLFVNCCEVLDRTIKVDYIVDLLENYPEQRRSEKMQSIELKEAATMASVKNKNVLNGTGLSLSSQSETDTMLLERARKLLQGNNESRKMECRGLEVMEAFAGNNRRSLSSSSSCPIYTPCQGNEEYKKRKLP